MSDALDRVRIAAPCSADWAAMTPSPASPHARRCAECRQEVFDVSDMTRAEALALLSEHAGARPPCLRLYQRADGTVLTADCPVGLAARVRRRVAGAWARVAALLGLSIGTLGSSGCFTMGAPLPEPPPPGGVAPAPPPVMRRAPRDLTANLHELVPERELLTPARRPPRLLPRAR